MPLQPDVRDAVWRALLSAHGTVVDRLERELSGRLQLPLSFYDVLAALAATAGGRMRMQELAEVAGLSKSGLTRLVQRMEADALVVREACDDDRRGTWAVLTAAGRSRWIEARPVHAEVVGEQLTDRLEPQQAEALVQALRQVAVGLNGR